MSTYFKRWSGVYKRSANRTYNPLLRARKTIYYIALSTILYFLVFAFFVFVFHVILFTYIIPLPHPPSPFHLENPLWLLLSKVKGYF